MKYRRSVRRSGRTTRKGRRKSEPLPYNLVEWLVEKCIVDSLEWVGITLTNKVAVPVLEMIRRWLNRK